MNLTILLRSGRLRPRDALRIQAMVERLEHDVVYAERLPRGLPSRAFAGEMSFDRLTGRLANRDKTKNQTNTKQTRRSNLWGANMVSHLVICLVL